MKSTDYLIIPYAKFGRNREGVDCWGLVRLIYKDEFNIDLPGYEGIDWKDGKTISANIELESQSSKWIEIPREERQTGDIITLKIKGLPWHIGVLMNTEQFIHAEPICGVCVERLGAIHWKSRVDSFYRYSDK